MPENKNNCGILAGNLVWQYKDINGCLKPESHNDAHVFKTQDGKLIKWEDDYSCKCGCWDDYDEHDSEACVVFQEVENIND